MNEKNVHVDVGYEEVLKSGERRPDLRVSE